VPSPPLAEVGVPITALEPSASGGFGTKAWRLDGTLPRGLTFDARTGAITGTPKAPGTSSVTVVVTDGEGRSAGVDLTIVINARLTIAPAHLAAAQAGRRYQGKITALGGVGEKTFTLFTGRLPAGVHLNATTGTLRGTPRKPGSYAMVIEARDALTVARRAFVLNVR
jgi:hypothetical protein